MELPAPQSSTCLPHGNPPNAARRRFVNRRHYSSTAHADPQADVAEQKAYVDRMAERIAFDICRALLDYLQGDDPTTRRIMKKILEIEEEQTGHHANRVKRTE